MMNGIRRFTQWGLWFGGALVLLAAVLIGIDVLMRKFLARSIGGADELAGYSLAIGTAWISLAVIVIFLSLSAKLLTPRHGVRCISTLPTPGAVVDDELVLHPALPAAAVAVRTQGRAVQTDRLAQHPLDGLVKPRDLFGLE